MEYFLHRLQSLDLFEGLRFARRKILRIFKLISLIGYSPALDDYEKRKLGIFNQLNFFQLITGIVVPIAAFATSRNFSANSAIRTTPA